MHELVKVTWNDKNLSHKITNWWHMKSIHNLAQLFLFGLVGSLVLASIYTRIITCVFVAFLSHKIMKSDINIWVWTCWIWLKRLRVLDLFCVAWVLSGYFESRRCENRCSKNVYMSVCLACVPLIRIRFGLVNTCQVSLWCLCLGSSRVHGCGVYKMWIVYIYMRVFEWMSQWN